LNGLFILRFFAFWKSLDVAEQPAFACYDFRYPFTPARPVLDMYIYRQISWNVEEGIIIRWSGVHFLGSRYIASQYWSRVTNFTILAIRTRTRRGPSDVPLSQGHRCKLKV
jgi:hypothetical protein